VVKFRLDGTIMARLCSSVRASGAAAWMELVLRVLTKPGAAALFGPVVAGGC